MNSSTIINQLNKTIGKEILIMTHNNNQTTELNPKIGDLNLWYIHQVPGKPIFQQRVDSVEEGRKILNAIFETMLNAFEQNMIPDYANFGGINRWEPDDEGGYNWCYVEENEDPDDPYLEYLREERARLETKAIVETAED